MRSKSLLYAIAMLLVLGFASSASAENDGAGDNRVAGYDITSADCVVYDFQDPPQPLPEYMKIGLEMDSLLPGIVLYEFDVDDNINTGGSVSMTGVFNPCVGGAPKLKVQEGIDIMLMLMLRDQADAASTAWCAGCFGPPIQCTTRAAACTGCVEGDCYQIGPACDAGDPDCYERGDTCTGCVEDDCVVLADPCELTTPCDAGRIKGEWYCSLSADGTGAAPFARGRIDEPLPKGTDEDSSGCYQVPWKDIIERAIAADAGANSFDYAKAADVANLKWQASAWISLTSSPPDDFMNTTGFPCLEVSDVVPNTGLAAARHGNLDCVMNPNQDEGVDALDLDVFLSEFGYRILWGRPCPVCK